MKRNEEILQKMLQKHYFTTRELRYGKEPGFFLSGFDYKEFTAYQHEQLSKGDPRFESIPLLAWNGPSLFYACSEELVDLQQDYFSMVYVDYLQNDESLSLRKASAIARSRIYSEIEGSLNIESVPTTRKRVTQLLEQEAPVENKNDQIIKNMARAMDFVAEKPSFNKENLKALYDLLSEDSLEEDQKLRPGEFYRYDDVEVDHYHGCPANKIDECMDSLFAYVNANLKEPHFAYLLPHIAHYYILYVHPYFDFNGRTARMVSLWINLLMGKSIFPTIVSEAIDQTKGEYYRAIAETRDSGNDLTYFLIYLYKVSIAYLLTYENLEMIDASFQRNGISWSESEQVYYKKILISYKGPFAYKDFLRFTKTEMSKQGALKVLNHLVSLGLLQVKTVNKTKVFSLSQDKLTYLPPSLRKALGIG